MDAVDVVDVVDVVCAVDSVDVVGAVGVDVSADENNPLRGVDTRIGNSVESRVS